MRLEGGIVNDVGHRGSPPERSIVPGRRARHIGRFQAMTRSRIFSDCGGQDLAEYAMLISLITLALIAAITLIGSRISAMFTAVAGAF